MIYIAQHRIRKLYLHFGNKEPTVFLWSDQWRLLIVSVTGKLSGPQLSGQIHVFFFLGCMASSTTNGKWGWCSSHEISHAARQNIYHVLFARYAAVTRRSLSFGEAINTEDLIAPLISVCKWSDGSPRTRRTALRFTVIVCLGIRLGHVSFHARDDNNGCHCWDDCWHHNSCALPHTSIFTCCTDAPEVNEFFTLEFRAGS